MQYVLLFVAVAGVATAGAQELSLEEALRQADAHSPRLVAQRHAVAAAEQQTTRAGELPDPRFKLGLENLPVTGPDRFRYGVDSMTAGVVGLAQEFPNAAKRGRCGRSGFAKSKGRDCSRVGPRSIARSPPRGLRCTFQRLPARRSSASRSASPSSQRPRPRRSPAAVKVPPRRSCCARRARM